MKWDLTAASGSSRRAGRADNTSMAIARGPFALPSRAHQAPPGTRGTPATSGIDERWGFDVYNILNRNPVITNTFTFVPGGTWLRPSAILSARFVRFSATVDF